MSSTATDDSDDYLGYDEYRATKRRKTHTNTAISDHKDLRLSFSPLLQVLGGEDDDPQDFEVVLKEELLAYEVSRSIMLARNCQPDQSGFSIRPFTRSEAFSAVKGLVQGDGPPPRNIARRKIQIQQAKKLDHIAVNALEQTTLSPVVLPPENTSKNDVVIGVVNAIQTTPYQSSFLARLSGSASYVSTGLLSVDWQTVSPWMDVMQDVREHYLLLHPDREQPVDQKAPIVYDSLKASHLRQVHDLLTRVFWDGINVSDSLDWSPERCTVVAIHKFMVVGVAILSSPQETYITYLAVKAGWDNSNIATTMLYHLISLNPHKDITLHVSTNNPAMLLYNRFGFKAEEFIAGFYDNFLSCNSRTSRNAFKLRLRQQ